MDTICVAMGCYDVLKRLIAYLDLRDWCMFGAICVEFRNVFLSNHSLLKRKFENTMKFTADFEDFDRDFPRLSSYRKDILSAMGTHVCYKQVATFIDEKSTNLLECVRSAFRNDDSINTFPYEWKYIEKAVMLNTDNIRIVLSSIGIHMEPFHEKTDKMIKILDLTVRHYVLGGTMLVVTSSRYEITTIYNEMVSLLGQEHVQDFCLYVDTSKPKEVISERIVISLTAGVITCMKTVPQLIIKTSPDLATPNIWALFPNRDNETEGPVTIIDLYAAKTLEEKDVFMPDGRPRIPTSVDYWYNMRRMRKRILRDCDNPPSKTLKIGFDDDEQTKHIITVSSRNICDSPSTKNK